MASTAGLSAWEKYFKGKGNVEVPVKSAAKLKDVKTQVVTKTIPAGTLVTLLEIKDKKEYLSYASGTLTNPKVKAWLPVKYESKTYLCDIDSLAKPKESGRIDLGIQTSNMIEGEPIKKLDVFGQKDVDCIVFTSAKKLAEVCHRNASKNLLLKQSPNFKKSLLDYFDTDKFDPSQIKWYGSISDKERAEFKYIGEISIAMCLLDGKKSQQYIKGDNPFAAASIKSVIFPVSQSFTGVDSIVELADGTMLPVSSKAGEGAAASFFANLFSKVIENPKYAPNGSVLKKILDAATRIGINQASLKTKSKRLVYEYGVRDILKVSKTQLSDSYTLFEEFKAKDGISKYSTEVRSVFQKLQAKMKQLKDATALKNLDSSTTVFFSKMIAEELNNDSASIKAIEKILGAKGYYQVNLNMKELSSGKIRFSVVKSGEGSVKIIGTKSAYTNIDASQGTVNYILEREK